MIALAILTEGVLVGSIAAVVVWLLLDWLLL